MTAKTMILRLKVPCLNGKTQRVSIIYGKTLVLATIAVVVCLPVYYFHAISCHQTHTQTVCHQVVQGIAIG